MGLKIKKIYPLALCEIRFLKVISKLEKPTKEKPDKTKTEETEKETKKKEDKEKEK